MTKEINPSDAPSWDEEEYQLNLQYLEDRLRFDEAEAVRAARESSPKKTSRKAAAQEDDDE